jgi:hypothetical protein
MVFKVKFLDHSQPEEMIIIQTTGEVQNHDPISVLYIVLDAPFESPSSTHNNILKIDDLKTQTKNKWVLQLRIWIWQPESTRFQTGALSFPQLEIPQKVKEILDNLDQKSRTSDPVLYAHPDLWQASQSTKSQILTTYTAQFRLRMVRLVSCHHHIINLIIGHWWP